MKKHIKTIHEGRKDYKCEYCGKLFGQNGSMWTHVRMVHKGRKEECNICNKSFHPNALLNHIKQVHKGQKQFKCNICNTYFGIYTL